MQWLLAILSIVISTGRNVRVWGSHFPMGWNDTRHTSAAVALLATLWGAFSYLPCAGSASVDAQPTHSCCARSVSPLKLLPFLLPRSGKRIDRLRALFRGRNRRPCVAQRCRASCWSRLRPSFDRTQAPIKALLNVAAHAANAVGRHCRLFEPSAALPSERLAMFMILSHLTDHRGRSPPSRHSSQRSYRDESVGDRRHSAK